MRTEQLYFFLETVKCGSYSQAARNLFIKQPSLKEAINNLERELGGKLFTTTNKGVSLTKLGYQCLPLFTKIIQTYEEAKVSSREDTQLFFDVGIDHYGFDLQEKLPYNFFVSKFPLFHIQNYSINQDYTTIIKKVINKELDLGCFVAPAIIKEEYFNDHSQIGQHYICESVFPLPMSLNINPLNDLYGKKEIKLKDLESENIFTSGNLQYLLQDFLKKSGVDCKVYTIAPQYRYNRLILSKGVDLEDHILQYNTDFKNDERFQSIDVSNLFKLNFFILYSRDNNKKELVGTVENIADVYQQFYRFKTQMFHFS